jgi:hypothetical protein
MPAARVIVTDLSTGVGRNGRGGFRGPLRFAVSSTSGGAAHHAPLSQEEQESALGYEPTTGVLVTEASPLGVTRWGGAVRQRRLLVCAQGESVAWPDLVIGWDINHTDAGSVLVGCTAVWQRADSRRDYRGSYG